MTFAPANSKFEAVERMMAGIGIATIEVSTGSTVQKSNLVKLAHVLAIDIDERATKPEFAGLLARALAQPWGDDCHSAGGTVTLTGLNRILKGAEQHPGWGIERATDASLDVLAEPDKILTVLADVVGTFWDGRACIKQMHAQESRHWAQSEWAGFYFEHVGIPSLVRRLGGGPETMLNTSFDYVLDGVWDLKTHSTPTAIAPLNDKESMEYCVSLGRSLGFVVLDAEALYESLPFRDWHTDFKVSQGKKISSSNSENRRKLKEAVVPQSLTAYQFSDAAAFGHAIDSGALTVFNQGKQASGEARKPKMNLNLKVASREGFVSARKVLGVADRTLGF